VAGPQSDFSKATAEGAAPSRSEAARDTTRQGRAGPGPVRALAVLGCLALGCWFLSGRVDDGRDETVTKTGRLEVTAQLLERPDRFPERGAYRYTFVLRYRVLVVHRQDPAGRYPLNPGDEIFVGHYKPWMPRSEIGDAGWGDSPLGGRLGAFVTGEAHRMALDYELQDLAPAGVLDYCFPQGVNRFFAVWTNPTNL
jgi:hypothetical protein